MILNRLAKMNLDEDGYIDIIMDIREAVSPEDEQFKPYAYSNHGSTLVQNPLLTAK